MQTKRGSTIETCSATAIGFVISWLAWEFPLRAMERAGWITMDSTTFITLFFTVLSLARGYVMRRTFNRLFDKTSLATPPPLKLKDFYYDTDRI